MRRCRICEGNVYLLGQLGCLLWFKCRSCGMEFNKETDECDYLEGSDGQN